MKIKRAAAAAAMVIGLLGVSSCSGGSNVVIGHGSTLLPADTVQDWVTYGDYAQIITVQSEREGEQLEKVEVERGEGTVPRTMRVAPAGEVMWQRATWKDRSAIRSEPFEITDGLYEFEGDKRHTILFGGKATMTVGGNYLALFARTNGPEEGSENQEWVTLTVLPLDGDTIRFTEQDRKLDIPEAQLKFEGQSVREVAATLASTPVEASAKSYMGLDPFERYQKSMEG